MTDLGPLLAEFDANGRSAGHSGRTRAARAATVVRAARDGVDMVSASRGDLVAWLAGLPVSRNSRATYRAHIVAWFKWLVLSGHRSDDPAATLPAVGAPRGIPHPVTPAEVARILAACEHPRAATTRAYVLLAAFAGLRAHEIAKVRGSDFAGGVVRVDGKGGVVSTVPVHPLIADLAATMPNGYWFASDTPAGHVRRESVSLAIGRAMRRAGVANVPHGLRHHFGTEVLRATGGDLRMTQRAMRHASPATTAIYPLIADDALASAVHGIPVG